MKMTQSKDLISVTLNADELWFLAQFFAPGLIFGVDDPTEGLDEDALEVFKASAYESLNQAGVLEMETPDQFRMDEMLGAMVYSCVHSTDMLVLKSPNSQEERFYHFLPEWQLELSRVEEGHALTLFKERSDLFDHILGLSGVKLQGEDDNLAFSSSERDLELGAYLYESGKTDQALEMFTADIADQAKVIDFIQGYIAPELHLVFDMLYDRDDDVKIHDRRFELLQTGGGLYWLTHDQAGEESLPIVIIQGITPEDAKKLFDTILP